MTTTAAAPSFSGQALPAVTVPPSRKTGFSSASPSRVVPGRGPSSLVTTLPSGVVTGMISRSKNPDSCDGHRADLRLEGELVLFLPGDLLELGHVLGGLAHRDVDVGEDSLERRPGRARLRRALGGPALGRGERLVVRADIGGTEPVTADRFDAGGDEDVALTGTDRVGGHPDGLERGGAVAVDGHSRHVRQPGEQRGDSADVVAGLTGRLTVAEEDVLDRVAGRAPGSLARTSLITSAARSSGRQSTREPFLARPIGVRPVATMTASGMWAPPVRAAPRR